MIDFLIENKKIVIIISIVLVLAIAGTVAYKVFTSKNKYEESEFEQESKQAWEEYDSFDDEAIAEQFEEPEEGLEEGEKPKVDQNKNSDGKSSGGNSFLIKVNKQANVVTVYKKDDNGDYTVPVKAMICSTGPYTPSCGKYPKSSYQTKGGKRRWALLQGNVYGQYATQIVGNILFHSVPYTAQNPSALEYWEYDKLGTAASAGCIRLTVADAQWVYNNIGGGTTVEFYSSSNPGPLGKPSAQKISSNEKCRGWDPTDWSEGNPWKSVSVQPQPEELDAKPEETNETNTTTNTSTNSTTTNKTSPGTGTGKSSGYSQNTTSSNTTTNTTKSETESIDNDNNSDDDNYGAYSSSSDNTQSQSGSGEQTGGTTDSTVNEGTGETPSE